MNRKILFGALGAALLLTSGPAHAGAGALAGQAQREDRGDRGQRGGGDNFRGGQRDNGGGGGQRQWQGGGDRGGGQRQGGGDGGGRQRGQWQGGQAPQAQAPPQAPQAQAPRQDGGRRWAQGGDRGGGGDRGQWRGQNQPQQPQQNFRNGGQNDGRWANNRGNDGGRNFNNNRGGDNNRNFSGNNRAWDNRGWAGNNGHRGEYRYRDNRERRSYAAIPYGRFFGPSYGSIASRYYGRSYVYYGSRSWGSSWNRPYRVGYLLPPSLYCSEVPDDLYYDLPPAPYGYDYALCGRDILLIGLDSRLVIDAIVGW